MTALKQEETSSLEKAREALRSGGFEHAVELYEQLLAQDNCADYHSELGIAFAKMGRSAEAEKHMKIAFAAEPNNKQYVQNISTFLVERGRQIDLLEYYEEHLKHIGFELGVYYQFTSLLERCNQLERSREITNIMLEKAPDSVVTIAHQGKLLARENKREEALSYFKANLNKLDGEPHALVDVYFDMSKLADKLGHYDDAIAYATTANQMALKITNPPVDKMEYLKKVSFFHSLLTADYAKRAKFLAQECDESEPSPVFMLGFPRSGTTLTHQIIEGHSKVRVFEEPPYMQNTLAYALEDYANNTQELFANVTAEQLKRYRAYYWQCAGGELDGDEVVIDKLPLHTVAMAWINLLFPKAKILFIQRHPFDAVLSCFMQPFVLNTAMANFVSLQESLVLYSQTMQIWQKSQKLIASDVCYIKYEELTSTPKRLLRNVTEFLGLEWEAALLEHDKRAKERFINTPSYAQVSQPIYTSSQAKWLAYKKYFLPYKSVMHPYLEAFGYDSE